MPIRAHDSQAPASARHRVVVVGGGFGALQAVAKLRPARVEVALVDHRTFHFFLPLTYQVATGALSPGEIAYPLRAIFKGDRNVRVLLAEGADFGLDARAAAATVRGCAGTGAVWLRPADRRRRIALLVLWARRVARTRGRGRVRVRDASAEPVLLPAVAPLALQQGPVRRRRRPRAAARTRGRSLSRPRQRQPRHESAGSSGRGVSTKRGQAAGSARCSCDRELTPSFGKTR